MVCVTVEQTANIASFETKLTASANTTKPMLAGDLDACSSCTTEDIPTVPVPVSAHGQAFLNNVRSVAANRLVAGNELNFENYTKLGQGSIAVVLRAKFGGCNVAVKMLRTDLGSDKKREQMAAADLNREFGIMASMPSHPHIIGFIAAGLARSQEQSMQPVIVYEFLGAGSVESFFQTKSGGKNGSKLWVPPREQSVQWCRQLYSAVEHLHALETPLSHRDIKPANLLMSADMQTVKLCDFSLATPLYARVQSMTNLPSIAGSLRYMAPEVSINAPFSLEKTDVFSAAMTSFFLVHGCKPLTNVDARTAQQYLSKGIRPVVEDPEIAHILELAWAVDPKKRPSAAHLRQRLEEIVRRFPAKRPSLKKRILCKLGLQKPV